ncbi:MAG: response regulator [Pseudomonadota bacterium]
MMDAKTIHLVDDDEAIRHSASFMLRHAGYTVRTYKDGVTFLEEAGPEDTGCILLDVRMPIMDGLEVQAALADHGIAMPVIVLTGHGDVSVAVAAMKAGAVDFLEKPYEKQALLDAVEKGFRRAQDAAGEAVRAEEALAQIALLTARERDVLDRLVDGMTNKAIAEDLNISARTVEIHRANMMEKLEAESLSAALKLAFSAGIGFD